MDIIIALVAVSAAAYAVYWYVKKERATNKQVDAVLDKIEADLKEATEKAAQVVETVKVEAAKAEVKAEAAVNEVKAKTKQVVAKVEEKAKATTKGRKPKK